MGIFPHSHFERNKIMTITEYRKNLEADGYKTKRINGEYFAYKDGKFYEFFIDWLGNKDFFEVSLNVLKPEHAATIRKAFERK